MFTKKMLVLLTLNLAILLFLSPYLFLAGLGLGGVTWLILRVTRPSDYGKILKNSVTNTFVILVSVLSILMMAEVYLHVFRPNVLEMNNNITGDFSDYTSRGYLTKKVFTKNKGKFRILGLGDSFAVFLSWDKKNYHDQLQEKYKDDNIEVVNAGMERTGPGYYYSILENYGDAIRPDLVMVGFFVGNDFGEMEFKYIFLGQFIKEPRNGLKRFASYLRFKNWWLWKVASRKLIIERELARRKQEKKEGIIGNEKAGFFSKEGFLEVERHRMWIFEKQNQARLAKLLERNSGVLLQFKKWCEARKIPLVVMIFPDEFQVEEDLRRDVYQRYGLDESGVDLAYPDNLLSEFCRRNHIRCLDLLGEFQQQGKTRKLYLPRETHWNEAGNRLAAEIISNYLEANGLLPARQVNVGLRPRPDGELQPPVSKPHPR